MSDIKKPNFFIVGFPKCGTTTMSKHLETHPDVFFSKGPHEPHYFNTDFPDAYRNYLDLETYLNECYTGSAGHKAVGESSPMFIYSKAAVSNILEFNPEAKFIVMVRNPVELARSLHAHNIRRGREDVSDFEKAWHLQEERSRGHNVPRKCGKPLLLQYGEYAKVGTYLKQLYEITPSEKVKVVFLNDLKENPHQIYKDVLNFLGLQDDKKTDFFAHNQNKQWKNRVFRSIVKRLRHAKRKTGIERNFGIVSFLRSYGMKEVSYQSLPRGFRRELEDYFKDEIDLTGQITGRDLSGWLK